MWSPDLHVMSNGLMLVPLIVYLGTHIYMYPC